MNIDSENTSRPAHFQRPDNRWLRVLIFLALLTFIGANVAYEKLKNAPSLLLWTMSGSLGVGLLFTLAYLIEMLTRRLRISIAELLGMIAAFAMALALVCQSTALIGGVAYNPAKAENPLNFVGLMIALLALMLRATVAAHSAAPYLPESAGAIVRFRRRTMFPREHVPSRWVFALYWLSPLAWWATLLCLAIAAKVGLTAPLILVMIFMLVIAGVRLLVLMAAYVNAFRTWRESRRTRDHATQRHALWYLGFNALGTSGAIAFYALCFASMRVQEEALAEALKEEEPAIVAGLRSLQSEGQNEGKQAIEVYRSIFQTLAVIHRPAYADLSGLRPSVSMFLRQVRPQIAKSHDAACESPGQVVPSSVDEEGSSNVFNETGIDRLLDSLMTESVMAAQDGDYKSVLRNTESILAMSRFLDKQVAIDGSTNLIRGIYWNGHCQADRKCAMNLLGCFLWGEGGNPTDEDCAVAQKLMTFDAVQRGNALVRRLRYREIWRRQPKINRSERAEKLRFFKLYGYLPGQWPGDLGFDRLVACAQLTKWHDHAKEVDYFERLLPYYEASNLELSGEGLVRDSKLLNEYSARFVEESLDTEIDSRCHLRLAEAALVAYRFKLKYSSWPADLEQCVPEFIKEIPRDPYNPTERLRFAGNPARVYSSGPGKEYRPSAHGDPPTQYSRLMNCILERSGNSVVFLGVPRQFMRRAIEDIKAEHEFAKGFEDDVNDEISGIKSPVRLTRQAALKSLSEMHADATPAIPDLIPLITSSDEEERLYAIYILGSIGPEATTAVPALRKAAEDADLDVRWFAKRALRSIERQ